MNITALIDIETVPEDDPGLDGISDAVLRQMEYHVVEALRLLGHEVRVLAFDADPEITVRALAALRPELVFNLTEHVGGDRRKDAHVAALLELLDLRYTGTGMTGLMLCRDKAICKRLLSHHRVRVPDFAVLLPGSTRPPRRLEYPVLVKPAFEDGSDGIALASLVSNAQELEQRVRMIHERMNQPAICEEYIQGREIYVGVVGNHRLQALPARELAFGHTDPGGPQFATFRVKTDEAYRHKWDIRFRHAELPETLEAKAARFSKRVYRLLQMRDYGRIDLRVTDAGELVFLEANPNPDLSRGDELAEAAEQAGIDYVELIRRIVGLALRRYKKRT